MIKPFNLSDPTKAAIPNGIAGMTSSLFAQVVFLPIDVVYQNQPNFRSTKSLCRVLRFYSCRLAGDTHIQVNPKTHQLKLCDFRSAKMLVNY
ncbi:hypothetical protein L1987_39594 [Smallanthus sonchifolius]|uniref:Uncharacterized protein n=1 Tax=Smallanthus sonchifolius TaxID=185202 RepID=A0ACB9HMQ7_9ASTR|nr:hypothetical protein L1987_39594 [Smallanthus sonchifolius]